MKMTALAFWLLDKTHQSTKHLILCHCNIQKVEMYFRFKRLNFDSLGLAYGEVDGRMGLELLNSWTPGIFVGILLDGK
ncbi:MAG TPA: hypothetical protein DCM38_12895, partial [Gammaproteobacteria bacterium]|nr:hypothetical protein [Gammaproteobacteria bacterium]